MPDWSSSFHSILFSLKTSLVRLLLYLKSNLSFFILYKLKGIVSANYSKFRFCKFPYLSFNSKSDKNFMFATLSCIKNIRLEPSLLLFIFKQKEFNKVNLLKKVDIIISNC